MFYSIHASRTVVATPAVFLDRDGTINIEKNYLYRIEDWEWIPRTKEAIKEFKQAGYRVVIVSNQAGIARGLYGPSDVDRLHLFVQQQLACIGTSVDAFYYCPHHTAHGENRSCECRKPKPGMLLEAAKALNIDLARSWLVGDKLTDLFAGQAIGVKGVLVQTGYGKQELSHLGPGYLTVADLPAAASLIIQGAYKTEGRT